MRSGDPVLRLALVGGGPGSFIGPVHRMAAELDGRIRLVAGAFSSDPARSIEAGQRFGIVGGQCHSDWHELIARAADIDLIAITTPNHLHFPIARAAIGAGIHVMSDKPATTSLADALVLAQAVAATQACYALSYTYTGYGAIRAARALCAAGRIGTIRKVAVEYIQGWLSSPIEAQGNKQARWRTEPAQAGLGGCIADIGVHAFNLAEFVTGKPVEAICPELLSVVEGRPLDDDCTVLLRFDGGARGLIHASQIATGARNGLRLRVWGDKGGLAWDQERPDRLELDWPDATSQTLHAGTGGPIGEGARLPPGHPEGYIEALATLYRDLADAIEGKVGDAPIQGIEEGVRGMAFIDASVRGNGAGWAPLLPAG